jgi:hypothetical protein
MKADILWIMASYYMDRELTRIYDIYPIIGSAILYYKAISGQTFGLNAKYRLRYNNTNIKISINSAYPFEDEIGEYCYDIKIGKKYTHCIIWDDDMIHSYMIQYGNNSRDLSYF